jgi:hypothetical protein
MRKGKDVEVPHEADAPPPPIVEPQVKKLAAIGSVVEAKSKPPPLDVGPGAEEPPKSPPRTPQPAPSAGSALAPDQGPPMEPDQEQKRKVPSALPTPAPRPSEDPPELR